MVSPHSSKYHRMSHNVLEAPRGSQMLPDISRSSQTFPEAPRSSQRFIKVPRHSQRLPDAPRSSQTFPEVPRNSQSSQKLPKTPGGSQKLPEAPRSSQKVPKVPRSSQRFPQAPRSSQRLPEAPRGSQKLPEAPRSSQRLPKAPKSSRQTDLVWQRDITIFKLFEMRRCKCSDLKWKLELLRTQKPSPGQLKAILRKHRAPRLRTAEWRTEPSQDDIAQILKETPNTVFLTYTKWKTKQLNFMILDVLFGHLSPAMVARTDPKENEDNYEYGELLAFRPGRIPIYIGMRLTITRNEDKSTGYVNGMGCTVRAIRRHGVEVLSDHGVVLNIHPRDEEAELQNGQIVRTTFLPIRVGYAVNLHKASRCLS